MSPTTWQRFSMFLIAVALVVGVIAARPSGPTLVMVFVVAAQIVALRRCEQRLPRDS